MLDRKIRYCSLPEAIREHFLWGARSIVIAGTHGKTTTTSLAGWLLTHGGVDPSVLVGGIARNFGEDGSSYRIGQGRDFVIEGDEYDSAFFDKTAKFLKYLPDIAVINNVEFDHADIYADIDAVTLAFRRLVNLVPRQGLLLLGADSPAALALKGAARSRVETFGTGAGADWQAHDLEPQGTSTRFHVRHAGSPFGTFEVPLLGAHNVRNALAAIAVAAEVGISAERIAEGLRRLPASSGGSRSSGRAARRDRLRRFRAPSDGGRRNARRASRRPTRRAHLGGLRAAIGVVVPARVPGRLRARVRRRRRGRAGARCSDRRCPKRSGCRCRSWCAICKERGKAAREAASIDEIVDTIVREHRPGDLVVVMSNGGFGGIHRKLLQALVVSGAAFRLVPAGDSVVVVEFEERIDEAVNAQAIRLAASVEAARIAGVRDVVPTYRSVAVYFDPLRTDYARVERSSGAGEPAATTVSADDDGLRERRRQPVRIPV